MNKSGIYKITNLLNNKFYIGSAVNFRKRWNLHNYQLNNNKHSNSYLQRAWDKYGKNNFVFEIIEYCDKENLLIKEQTYIDDLKPQYNLCKIAGSRLGTKATDEFKLKMKTIRIGFKHSKETKLKLALLAKGKKQSKETIEKKIKRLNKKICQYSLNGDFIKEWESVKIASKELKISECGISSSTKEKRRKSAGGYKWKYK